MTTDTPAAAPITAEREAFEAWALKTHGRFSLVDEFAGAAWDAWQARARLSAPVAAQPAASGVDAAMKLADEYANTLAATPFCGQAEIDIAREALRAHLSTALGVSNG
jgi:hypothetical protein